MGARRRARVFLESLPPERYPRLVEAAGPLSECEDPDAYYTFGLDLLLAGIEAMAACKPQGQDLSPSSENTIFHRSDNFASNVLGSTASGW